MSGILKGWVWGWMVVFVYDLTKKSGNLWGWRMNAAPRLLSDFPGIRKRRYIDFNNISFDLACPHPSPIHTPLFLISIKCLHPTIIVITCRKSGDQLPNPCKSEGF